MRHKPATYALLRLHAGLTNPLDRWHVEAAIQLLEPGFAMRPLGRRAPNPWFKAGSLFRHASEVLRAAGRPLTAHEITIAMLARRGIVDADPNAARTLVHSIYTVLRAQKGGSVEAIGSRPVHWKLAE
jgi:hypothetical protein